MDKLYEIKHAYKLFDRKMHAILWEPVELGEHSQIAVVSMHGGSNKRIYHNLMVEFARRGFRSMYAVPFHDDYPNQMTDFKLAVDFMKKLFGVKKVILMGQSRGAALMSVYQRVAENGIQVLQGSERLLPFPDVEPLTPADGLMLLDANYGFMNMLSVNPAVIEEGNAVKLEPSLDSTNPDNGYNPEGSHYSEEFTRKYLRAQVKRYKLLLDMAMERLHLIESGTGNYLDDEPFIIPEAFGGYKTGKLFSMDTRFLSHTRKTFPLLHSDGSISNEVIRSVRIPSDDASIKHTYAYAAWKTTVKNFLLSEIKLDDDFGYDEDHFWGNDWGSCFSCAVGNVREIKVPLLAMGMTGGYEYLDTEFIFENAVSTDKTIAFTEGASHGFDTAKETEKYPGQWGDTLTTTAEFVTGWISKKGRFIG